MLFPNSASTVVRWSSPTLHTSPELPTTHLQVLTQLSSMIQGALQDPALYLWGGDNNNTEKASQAFLDRLIENCKALETPNNS